MNRHLIRPATGAFVLLFALSGCSGSTSSEVDGTTTITFSSYNYGAPGAAGEGTQALLDRFAELHPDITVVPQGVPTAEVLTKAKTDVAAGSPSDVVQIGYSKLAEAFETLPVQSIEDIAGDGWADHAEGINSALLETGEHEGSVAAVPYTISIPTIFYNADLFSAAGIDPGAPLDSMSEVRDAAQAIVADGHQGVYFGIVDPGKSDYLTQSVINSAGGATVDGDGQATFDSPQAVDGLAQVQALTTDGLQPAVSTEDALASFSSGDLGMLVVSTSVAGTLQEAAEGNFELGTAAFPSFGSGPARPTFSGAGLMVLSDDKAQQQAAWTFIEFLTSNEGYTTITEKIGYLPLRAELADDPKYLGDYFAENTLLVPPLKQLETVSPYRFFPGATANQAVVLLQDDAISPIVLRGADPEATLTKVADRVRDLSGSR